MPTDVTIVLQNLHCIRESEGGSEPYIWPVLLWIDDNTIQTPDLVGMTTSLNLGNARFVLRSGMSAGETAPIPFPLGSLGVSFEDGLTMQRLLLVVALLENDETPAAAMWAGCKVFSTELRAAIAEKLLDLSQAIREQNDVQLKQIIKSIKERVRARVYSATWDALTGWQKTRVVLGTLNLDDFIGADYYFSGPIRTTFRLSFPPDEQARAEYTLDGMLDVYARPVTVDLCQAQVDRVKAAQAAVDGLDAQINLLKEQLKHATPQQKASIVAQIAWLNHELSIAMAALEDARRGLQDCRSHWVEVSKSSGAATGVGSLG